MKSKLLTLAIMAASICSTQSALAAGVSRDCDGVLQGNIRQEFSSPADEVNYTNLYLSCWGQYMVTQSQSGYRSYLGNGLKLFANMAAVEASGFSKNLCASVPGMYGRKDYACWFERETAVQNVSMEEAAKREAPKILFSDIQQARDGSDVVKLVLCKNDDPTRAKEYSKGCKNGENATITEYGRGDFNKDNLEDIMVSIKYGSNTDPTRKCYLAAFTRQDGDYFRMINFSWVGLCEY